MTGKKVSIHLETTHHFCLKRIQNLPRSTRSDMMKGMLGFTSSQTYTYMQTLLFLGFLCRLQPEDTCFQLFIHRLYQQCTSTTNFSKGLITDIVFILHKYGLYHYFSIEEFTTTSTFPCKPVWKYVCKDSVFKYEPYMRPQRIIASSECSLFRDIHNSLTVSNIWKVSIEKPGSLELMTFFAKLVCTKIYLTEETGTICNDVFKYFLKQVLVGLTETVHMYIV